MAGFQVTTEGLSRFIELFLNWSDLVLLREEYSCRWLIDQVLLDYVDPDRPLRQAILKSRYRPPERYLETGKGRALTRAKDLLMGFVQAVGPFLPNVNNSVHGPSTGSKNLLWS
jgi:hypothetical protein